MGKNTQKYIELCVEKLLRKYIIIIKYITKVIFLNIFIYV